MPENIIASIKLPSNEIYKIRDKEARHFLNIENVTTSSPVIVNGGGAMQNSKISISISAAQLQAIADAWARYPDDLAIEFRLYIISEGGETGSNPFCSWVVADRAVLTPVSLTTEQGVPLAGTYYVFIGTAETLDTLKSYPFTLKINTTNGSGVLDFTVGAAVDHTHGLINSDGTIDSTTVVSIPELTSDPTKAYSILVNDTVNDGLLRPTAVAFGRDDRNAFLNKDGTWSSPSEGHFYVTGADSVAAKTTSPYNAAQWKGSNSNITALYTGLSINYTLDVTGNATYGTVLDINELGAHPVVSHTGAPIGNTYAANAVIQLEYDATATADVYINSTEATTVTGCWKLALAQTPPYFVEGQNSIAAKTSKSYYASIWNGTNPAVKALYSGLAISYKIDVAGHSTYGVVLNLNGWGEHPVVRNVNTTISTVYAVGSIVNLIYDAEQSASVYLGSGAVSVKGCWKIADYDTNTQIVYRLLQNYSHPYVDSNSGPLYRYEVCFTTPNDTIIPISSVSNKPTVYTKEFTSIPFDPFRPIYYYATTTTVNPGDSITGSALYDVYLIDARYGFNINSAGAPGVTALETNKMVYLRAKYNTLTHLATFDQDLESENYLERSSLVQDLPSTNPNTVAGNTLGPNEIYIYIYLGIASSEYAIDKAVTNFVYYWDTLNNCINVFYGDTEKEDKINKVTSLSASSTDTQYPSAKAVYDALAGVAPTVIYTGTCNAVIGSQNQYATLADSKTGADIAADIDANRTVVLRITDSASDTYDFIYSGKDIITASGEEDQKEYYFTHISDGNEYIPAVVENTSVQICKTTKIEVTDNKVTSLSSSSTNTEYPSAKVVYDELLNKENIINKVTSLSSLSTDTEYPSAKAVYDALAGVAPTVIYTGTCNAVIGSQVQTATLDDNKTYTDIITDLEANKVVLLRLRDSELDTYDFIYVGKQDLYSEPSNEKSYYFALIKSGYYIPVTIYNSVAVGKTVNIEITDNKVTSISNSSTNTEYPSAKAVYDITKPKLYTAVVSGDLSHISRPITVSSFHEGLTSEVIADVNAGKYVIIRITDGQPNTYDFIYIGYTTAHTFRNIHDNSYIDLEFDSSNPPVATIGQNIDTFEVISNRVTSLSASSTHIEYPSAKTVYDAISSINVSDKLKYITITPISGAWDASEGTYSCTISAADYTKVNSAWSTDDFCVKTTINFPGANSTTIPVSFTLFKALTTTFENTEYYVFNAHYTGSTELDLEFADYDSFIFCISKAGAAGEAHSCLGFVHQGTTETDVINIINTRLANYVDLTTNQTVGGVKTFTSRPLSADIYTKIAYLQSDYNGTTVTNFAYIKTGVRRGVDWTNKLTTELDGYFNVSQALGFCGYDSGGQLGQVNGKWGVETATSSVDCIGVENRAVVKQVIDLTTAKDTLYINDTQIAQRATGTVSTYSTNFDYPIFVAATSGGYTYRPAALTLYRFKMYNDSDILIRDFVPARTSSGQIGLLDTVNNVFYMKEGDGTLTAGADTSETVVISNPLLTAGDVAPVALSNDYNDLINKPTIPATGRLNTNNSTALTPSSSESFSSTIALHKISKTGSYADLLNKPSDGSAGIASVANDIVTLKAGITQSGLTISNSTGTEDITLAKVAKTGDYTDLSNKPTAVRLYNEGLDKSGTTSISGSNFAGAGSTPIDATIGDMVLGSNGVYGKITAWNTSTHTGTATYDHNFVIPVANGGTGIEADVDTNWYNSFDLHPCFIVNIDTTEDSFTCKYYGPMDGIESVQTAFASEAFLRAMASPVPIVLNTGTAFIGTGLIYTDVLLDSQADVHVVLPDAFYWFNGEIISGLYGELTYDAQEGIYLTNLTFNYPIWTNNEVYLSDGEANRTIVSVNNTTHGVYHELVTALIDIDSTQVHRTALNDVTITASDVLPVFDTSDNNKLRGSLTFDGSTTTQFLSKKGSWETPANTTYTFASGTNSFTVTPSGGQSQTVTVTPSITNNITGTGTAGALAKFNDAHTLVDGPILNSTDTTTFLRHDGTWVAPPATVVDSALDSNSTNPVQNKVVTGALNTKVDLTSNQTIDGEKTFLQRPVVSIAVDLPAEYTQLESIKGDGTAYINTGRKYSTDDKIYLSFKQATTQNYRIWGTFNQSGYTGPNVSMTYSAGWMVRQETVAGQARGIGLPAIDTNRHSVWILSDGTVVFDGVDYSRTAGWAAGYTFNYNAYLFTINPGGTTPTASLNGYIYQYRVWDAAGVLVQDMYPVARTSGGTTTYGMYDIIEGQFYGNAAGSGAFSAGQAMPMASTVVIESDLKPVAYSGSYTDLSNRPTIPTVGILNTNNPDAQSVSSSESFGNTIKLHKVSKTGSFSDLLDKPSATISGLGTGKTITALSQTNGVISATATAIAITSTQVSSGTTATIASSDTLAIFDADDNKLKSSLAFNSTHGNQFLRKDGTWASTPTTTVGALSISSTGQSIPSSAESFTGNITLHNVAKTGSFSDLLNKPSATISGLATSKTLTVLTQTNGTISATAADIAITSTQVTAASTAATIATGDALIIADNSDSNKLVKTSITFDVNQQKNKNFLCENGTWVDVNTVIPAPMQFKGTVGGSHGTYSWATLPSASSENTGWTLKVLEAHTGIPTCKVGDTIISDGSIWVVIPSGDEPSGTVTSVALSEGSGIIITGGPITTSGVITVAHGNTSDVADTTNTGRTYIQNIDFDEFGHVLGTTSATETVTIPANNVTGSGASGYLAKFDGTNTITSGPLMGTDISTFLRNDGTWATPTDTNDKVKQIGVPSHPEPAAYGGYNILLAYGNEPSNTDEINFTRKSAMVYDPASKALTTGGTVNGYTLNAASAKPVDSSISAGSTSTNLPTSQAVASFVEGKGYTTVDTTYKFTDGTNGFTVTPVVNGTDGTGAFVNVTPSIANNVTGTGTSGYIAKFSGDHSITNGPQFGSSTTTFLNNSGTWTTPPNTTYTFTSGTNGFTVTPSGGTAQTVIVTPSIPIDIVVNETSTNAVQNKAIYEALPKVMRFI